MHLRAEYSVGSDLRFLSNLDMMHLMERSLRRAGIPYKLSEGFNPHIRLSMGTVLPVGLWGDSEYFDLELELMSLDEFKNRMNQVLPKAIKIKQCQEILPGTPSLMKTVNTALYAFAIKLAASELEPIQAAIMMQASIRVQNRGKHKEQVKDIRPGLYQVESEPQDGIAVMRMMVSVNQPVNIRFDELVEVLNRFGIGSDIILDFWRQGNYIKQGQEYISPLDMF